MSMSDKNIIQQGRTIAFDFDGVIAQYSGFVSADHVEEPNAETVQAIRKLKESGYRILIHSTRGDEFLASYCAQYAIPYDYLNRRRDKEGRNPGKPIAFVYVDDRAINFHGQSADELVQEIKSFKVWWE